MLVLMWGNDLVTGRLRVVGQEVRGAHDLTRLAVPALGHFLGNPRLLEWMAAIVGESFDGRDLSTFHCGNGCEASVSGGSVQMYHASAALADATAKLGSGELQMLPHDPEQGRIGVGIDFYALTIDRKVCHDASPS